MSRSEPQRSTAESPWKRRSEVGLGAGPAIVAWVATHLGRSVVGWFLHPIVLYFLLTRGPERRASRAFLRRALGRPAGLAASYAHFYTFARVATDRLYLLRGERRRLSVRIHGRPLAAAITAERRGCIVLSAHLGSFEAVRAIAAESPQVRLHIVLDRASNPNFIRQIEAVDAELAARVIDASLPANAVVLEIGKTLQQGGWVGLPGERYRAGDRTVECRFFGEPARFPLGPFAVATAFDVPVAIAIGLYLEGRYQLHFEHLHVEHGGGRAARNANAAAAAQRFAARLETYARMAPYNWFNFYDFWSA